VCVCTYMCRCSVCVCVCVFGVFVSTHSCIDQRVFVGRFNSPPSHNPFIQKLAGKHVAILEEQQYKFPSQA